MDEFLVFPGSSSTTVSLFEFGMIDLVAIDLKK